MSGFVDLGGPARSDALPACLILATDAEGRFLLQLRDAWPHVAWGGMWGLFGGGMEGDDPSPQHAAQREWTEEAGLALPQTAFAPYVQLTSLSETRRLIYVFRVTQPVLPADITLGEGAGFAFFAPEQLGLLRLVPSLEPVIAHWRSENRV